MRTLFIFLSIFLANSALCQSTIKRSQQISHIVDLTIACFNTNIVLERNDSKMALLSNSEFAEILNKKFCFDNSIGDSLKFYLTNGYNELSPWYSQISRYIISDSLYQQISRSSPCEVYKKYFDKGYPKDSIYAFEEIRVAAAYLIKNNLFVSPDSISYYSVGESPCHGKKRKKRIKKQ